MKYTVSDIFSLSLPPVRGVGLDKAVRSAPPRIVDLSPITAIGLECSVILSLCMPGHIFFRSLVFFGV